MRAGSLPKKGVWAIFDFDKQGRPLSSVSGEDPIREIISRAGALYPSKHCIVHVYKVDRLKSVPQIGYYYGVILPHIIRALDDIGTKWTRDRTHFYLKSELGINDEYVDPITKKSVYDVRSLSVYTVDEMSVYIENLIQWASEFLGVDIPPPIHNYEQSSELGSGQVAVIQGEFPDIDSSG
jgi:hypothetical protein